ncbi:MAG: hypothetical protein ACK5IN_04430 [Microbacterium sp.]|uniref:hypothetical protein n=1 Tax=Microbacterium sp. TaxID=51671 RepID=UPI003A894A0F
MHPQYAAAITSGPAPRRSPTLGVVALIAAGLAAVTPVVAAIAMFEVGVGIDPELTRMTAGDPFRLAILTPVRGWVLAAELSFWAGTLLGVWAFVQGIVATVRNRGRIAAIVAIVLAVITPMVFAVAALMALSTGVGTAGSSGMYPGT